MDVQAATREELIQIIATQDFMINALRKEIVALRIEIAALRGDSASDDEVEVQASDRADDQDEAPGDDDSDDKESHQDEDLSDDGDSSECDDKTSKSPPEWVKPNCPQREQKPRRKRKQGYARKRSKPTRQVVHALDECGGCGCQMRGGWTKRTREVLHIPLVPSEVIEHVFIERKCPQCGKRQTPRAEEVLREEVIGQHRVSIQTMSMIVCLRQEARLPVEGVQWILQSFFDLELSKGEIVEIEHAVAQRAKKEVDAIKEEIRKSRVVHGDETTWREDGKNGYFWSFSTPTACYFEFSPSRSSQMVADVMGTDPNTTMVCDFYAAYNRHPGPKQRCWVHLLRDIHKLKEKYPEDAAVQVWGKAVHDLYLEAIQFRERHREDNDWLIRFAAKRTFEERLRKLCEPSLGQDVPHRVLCQRCTRFLSQLFVFVLNLRVPPDNNAAERAIRPLTVARKISGGTRSSEGSKTKGALATLFATWRLRHMDPLISCRMLLSTT